jgi:hypothetical protein
MTIFDTFTRPRPRKRLFLTSQLQTQNPIKPSIMTSLIRKTLRLVPVALFVFAGGYASAQNPQHMDELLQIKAKIEANADNPNFNMAEAQAGLEAKMAEYGITEIKPVGHSNGVATSIVPPSEPTSIAAEPDNATTIRALKAEIELYANDPAMADYVNSLREKLAALEPRN